MRRVVFVVGLVISVAAVIVAPDLRDRYADEASIEATSTTRTHSSSDELGQYCEALTAGSNSYVGEGQRERVASQARAAETKSPARQAITSIALARDHLRFGETASAVNVLETALERENSRPDQRDNEPALLRELAITQLKMGELDNCLTPSGSLICTLPLDTNYVHSDRRGSESAIQTLEILLSIQPDDIKSRWLLNIAHMTLGTYPQDVPQAYLLPPGALESDYDIGRFENIAPSVGLYTFDLAGGSIVEDFDNDGLLDIITSTWDPCGSMRYFHNDGRGGFSDLTASAGLESQLGGLNLSQTDYNNDGWMDVVVMRGGWMQTDGQMRRSLLRNNGDGSFTDVTHDAGLGFPAYPSQSVAWADYDSDGDLDMFSCNESQPDPDLGSDLFVFPSQLFRNDGDGTFTDVAVNAGVTNERYCKGSDWGDFDNDGDPDLYVSNFGSENRLYRNDGHGSFEDVAMESGVSEPINSFPTWFWDYDNDGWLDIFVSGYNTNIASTAADYFELPRNYDTMHLYRNNGAGQFIDVTKTAMLDHVRLSMGANFGDLDNDGFQDFYLGTGAPGFDAIAPNSMYRNDKGKSFQDVTFSGGFGHLHKGHGISFGDLDRDGDQDVFAQIGGFYPGGAFSNALYENPGHGNRWVSVRLVGHRSNRAAIGARIEVVVDTPDGPRSIHALVGSGGSFGASSLEQEIGLGDATGIRQLEIYWPATGIRQVFDDVSLDSRFIIHEDNKKHQIIETKPFKLGGGPR